MRPVGETEPKPHQRGTRPPCPDREFTGIRVAYPGSQKLEASPESQAPIPARVGEGQLDRILRTEFLKEPLSHAARPLSRVLHDNHRGGNHEQSKERRNEHTEA